MTSEDLARLREDERALYERSKDDRESRMIVGSEVRAILSRLALARRVVKAARVLSASSYAYDGFHTRQVAAEALAALDAALAAHDAEVGG